MKKDIRKYIHLYIGQKGRCKKEGDFGSWETILDKTLGSWINGPWEDIQLMLRPLSSMTDAERAELNNLNMDWQIGEVFRRNLEKGFDIFGLIEDGLAISTEEAIS